MNRKQLTLALVALAMVFATAVVASADCRKKINLSATAAGASIGAAGTAEARAEGTVERFKVSIDADAANGTTFTVRVSQQGNPGTFFTAGTITIAAFAGELDLRNDNGNVLPQGVDPVCSISGVQVVDGNGNPVLSGTF